MISTRQRFERNIFRTLNKLVEPAVRKGALSPQWAPVGLILLESIGYKSGSIRSTPLLAAHLGDYTFVSTFRGKRSFWVRNLQKQPDITFHRGGKVKQASSFVVTPESGFDSLDSLPPFVATIAKQLARHSHKGWAFAVLHTDS